MIVATLELDVPVAISSPPSTKYRSTPGSFAITDSILRAAALARSVEAPSGKRIETKNAPKPIGPYAQGVIAGGLLFCSGQIPVDPETSEVVEGGIEAQTDQVFKNLFAVLKDAKMGTDNVVKTTVYLADMAEVGRMNDVYARFLGKAPPARSTIRAGARLRPCSPVCCVLPRTTSSTFAGSIPVRSISALMQATARSSLRTSRNQPLSLWARPTGVRTQSTTTALFMFMHR